MKKIITWAIATIFVATLAIGCRAKKENPDYDKVDKSYREFKDRNPDSD
jgi:hypothetical protein